MGCAVTTKRLATLANAHTKDENEEKEKKLEIRKRSENQGKGGKEKKHVREEKMLRNAAEWEQQLRQGVKWRLSGDGRQGTPPRTISTSIAKTPSRKQSRCESKVVDAANCLFSGFAV